MNAQIKKNTIFFNPYILMMAAIAVLPSQVYSAQYHSPVIWPNNAKAAVSLSYDDALNSQLDNAIPALNRYKLKGSFYLTLAAESVNARLNDWRNAALQGHELGNHTLNHACRGSLPHREWVLEHNNLDNKSLAEIIQEVQTANSFLHAIDNEKLRTFTVPCTDQIVEGKNYIETIKHHFVGIKTHVGDIPQSMSTFDKFDAQVWTPVGVTGQALIDYVDDAANKGTIANLTFHGIGGDHLAVSIAAHQALLAHLAKNKDIFWVDTYRNISLYLATFSSAKISE